MNFRYEIDKNNAVWIFVDGNEVASVFQPDWPDTTPWANKAQAEAWAKAWIKSMTDPTAPFAGNSPSKPTEPRGDFVDPASLLPVAEVDQDLQNAIDADQTA
jgi:hypothetical protein